MTSEQQLHPNVIPYWRFTRLISLFQKSVIAGIPITVHLIWLPTWTWILYVTVTYVLYLWLTSLFYIFYGVRYMYIRRGYLLTNDEIVIRWGNIWAENVSVIPLSRVQHVDMEQDLIQRKLGISGLAIVTAGDATGVVGLLEADAKMLQRQIVELAKLGETDAYHD